MVVSGAAGASLEDDGRAEVGVDKEGDRGAVEGCVPWPIPTSFRGGSARKGRSCLVINIGFTVHRSR